MATSRPSTYREVNNENSRRVYSFACDQHMLAEIVSMCKYPLCCIRHVPVYLFQNMDDTKFINFHWVSNICFFKEIISRQNDKILKQHTKLICFFLSKETRSATYRSNLHKVRDEFN